MAKYEAVEARKLSVSTTDSKEDFVSLCTGCYLVADADCFVDFDDVATTGAFLVKANIFYNLEKVRFTQIHAITASGTANLYILAIRTTN